MIGSETTLALPLAHKAMWGRGRYANPVYGQHFLDVIRLMTELKLIARLTTGYRFSGGSKAPTLVRPTDALAEHLPLKDMDWSCIRRVAARELIILKAGKDDDGRSAPIDYRETRSTTLMRGQVARINKWLAAANIELVNDTGSFPIGDDGMPIAVFRRSVYRIFNNGSWQEGGRLWGGFWMSMKRAERSRMRINGEPITDVDYQQLYPRLAYARA
jgi:hypothetical protein